MMVAMVEVPGSPVLCPVIVPNWVRRNGDNLSGSSESWKGSACGAAEQDKKAVGECEGPGERRERERGFGRLAHWWWQE